MPFHTAAQLRLLLNKEQVHSKDLMGPQENSDYVSI